MPNNKRRGVTIVLVAVSMFMLLGFAVLVIDVGAMFNVRGDLQRTADSAALAGVSAYISDEMNMVRFGGGSIGPVITNGRSRVHEYAGMNATFGSSGIDINTSDIKMGQIDLLSATSPVDSDAMPNNFNAVSVLARRDHLANGPLKLFFAPIFGKSSTNITASATAAFDDRFSGIDTEDENGAGILPFTIHKDAFQQELLNGGDQYGFSEPNVYNGPDNIREIRLFPYPLSGDPLAYGDGNFGYLNIGNPSESAAIEAVQIEEGVSDDEFLAEIGTTDLKFKDDDGYPITYQIDGSPGLSATAESSIELRVGDIIAFFLHDNVVLSGAIAQYTITGMVYARVMGVNLRGRMENKYFYVQPVTYVGSDVIIDENSPSSNGLVGRIVLVR